MRDFFYFSRNARTSGNFDDLMGAGRIDIALHIIIMSFFVSNATRDNVKLHLFFYGQPDPPKHLELGPFKNEEDIQGISKKDLSGLLKRMLYKYKKGIKNEAFKNCWIEKKDIFKELNELKKQNRKIYILDDKGEDIRKIQIGENPIFVLGDQEGFNKKEMKELEQIGQKISIGKITYFASQTLAIIQNELDRQKIE
ncbi:hypothetical protein J4465_01120 [Candidatus Pacearchaeota archaeon]|nr:hypothetical protein [Candidatus Pacearchaeota archaeon]